MTYKVIKDDVDGLIGKLEEHKRNNSKDYYYTQRGLDRDPVFDSLSDVEKAARLIYLNKTCYNGLYRVNSMGHFNTPYGRYINPSIYDEEVLRAVHKYLKTNQIEINTMSFENAVTEAKKGDFVYFDPPYDSPNRTNFTGYQAGGFGQKEQEKLKEVMDRLTERDVKCMMSNAATEYILSTYTIDEGYRVERVRANRTIGSNLFSREKVDEVIIRNYKCDYDKKKK